MASAAESFLQKIGKTDFNDDESLRSLAQTFAFVKDKLVANPSHHAPILSQCRMPQNAAAAAMVMGLQATQQQIDTAAFLKAATDLFLHAPESHIKVAIEGASAVARRYTEEMISARRPAAALPALKRAMSLLSGGDSSTLTAAHACFLQAALASKHLGAARRVALMPVFHVQSSDLGTHHSDIMLHFFYSGSVLCAFQRWRDAAAAFRTAIAVPASSLSAIALDAYKKYVCACLLAEGREVPLPRHVSSAVSRSLPAAASAYGALGKAVAALNDEKLTKVMHEHSSTFYADQNSGLVAQVVASVRRRRVLRLTSTFVTLSLADIAAKAGLASAAEAEAELLSMVQGGQLAASIDHRVGVVTFPPEQGAFTTPAEMQRLRDSMAQATALAQHFARAQREAELSDECLEPRVRQAAIDEGRPLKDGPARGGGGSAAGHAADSWGSGIGSMASGFFGGHK